MTNIIYKKASKSHLALLHKAGLLLLNANYDILNYKQEEFTYKGVDYFIKHNGKIKTLYRWEVKETYEDIEKLLIKEFKTRKRFTREDMIHFGKFCINYSK